MQKIFQTFYLCSVLFAVLALSVTESRGQFFTLPTSNGLIEGISNNGIAVGSFGNPANQYFMWEVGVGGRIDIGGVPAGNGVGGQAKVSNDGLFIGGTTLNTVSGFHEASRYDVQTGLWTALGGIGGSSGSSISSGWDISGDGQSIVGLAWVNAGEAHATHWRNGSTFDLGSTIGTNSTRANAANFDGSVIAGWQDGAGRQGAVWVNGVQELIFDNGGNSGLEAFDITDDGRYVVGFDVGTGGPVPAPGIPYRYDVDTNTYLELGTLAVGAQRNAAANAITNDGRIVGGGTWGFGQPATFGNGFIWEEGLGVMPVADFLTSKGASGWPTNFNFNFVSAISPNGEWIGGWGGTGVGANQSWVVRIPPVLLGDVNCDGFVNLLDVAPFVDLLTSGGFLDKADINGDGLVNLLDIQPFVALLAG